MESGAAAGEGGNAVGRRAAGGGGAPERKRSKAKEVTVSLGRSIEYVNNSNLAYCSQSNLLPHIHYSSGFHQRGALLKAQPLLLGAQEG